MQRCCLTRARGPLRRRGAATAALSLALLTHAVVDAFYGCHRHAEQGWSVIANFARMRADRINLSALAARDNCAFGALAAYKPNRGMNILITAKAHPAMLRASIHSSRVISRRTGWLA